MKRPLTKHEAEINSDVKVCLTFILIIAAAAILQSIFNVNPSIF